MSNVRKSEQIIIIDDDAGTESNAQKSNPINSDSNVQREDLSRLTHTFTTMLGTLSGMSLEDVNKMMDSEKGLMTELHNVIETMSKIFKDSSNKEIPMTQNNNMSIINTSHNLNISTNKEIPMSSIYNVPIDKLNSQRGETSTDKSISVNPRVTLIKNEIPVNQQNNNLIGSFINDKGKSVLVTEESRKENYSSGIKIGDNWELPIIVLDSDDEEDETRVIEIDSDEEEIQELKKMMSLDDNDCIEIGRDEFERARKARETAEDTDDEMFIPIVPDDGSISRKRKRGIKPTKVGEIEEKSYRRKIEKDEIYDDPSVWRKDLLPFPHITNHVLRTWATGFLHYRNEWERLEYLGDKVLMFCVLRFATAKYLRYYTPSDIKVVTTFLVSNKLLAAYSLTLGLDKKNHMQGNSVTKKVADAFEAYIGAYYLSDGEQATTRYLEQLMSPLFELILSTIIQTGRNPHKIMKYWCSGRRLNVFRGMMFLNKINLTSLSYEELTILEEIKQREIKTLNEKLSKNRSRHVY
ncbi:hypothetical protein RclHR1_05820012 [Rhizophagus clarus]|uniref:RNase III domain-containing protein n=1 Tax=Rhizophagus clarus TaxID=94130 RepID=A0A2Z6S6B9_9GLOM|nr:hypothetical protein RclHR1_05820012 [Rhizophagus clarus]